MAPVEFLETEGVDLIDTDGVELITVEEGDVWDEWGHVFRCTRCCEIYVRDPRFPHRCRRG